MASPPTPGNAVDADPVCLPRVSSLPWPAQRRKVYSNGLPGDALQPAHRRVTDPALLDRLRRGDADAFDVIFRGLYGRLVGLAEAMLRDPAVAEEIAQDVMLELWRRRETLVLEAPLEAYLFRATRNRALNHLRHERIVQRAEPFAAAEVPTAPPADRDVADREIEEVLQAAVADLPPRCREVFELSRAHGLSYAEIAATMEISIKTVEAQMGKALRVLRQRLAPWLPAADI